MLVAYFCVHQLGHNSISPELFFSVLSALCQNFDQLAGYVPMYMA